MLLQAIDKDLHDSIERWIDHQNFKLDPLERIRAANYAYIASGSVGVVMACQIAVAIVLADPQLAQNL